MFVFKYGPFHCSSARIRCREFAGQLFLMQGLGFNCLAVPGTGFRVEGLGFEVQEGFLG